MTKKKHMFLTAAALIAFSASAEVKPARLLQDGMVVEWTKPLTLWGTADPNERFEIKINGTRKSRVQADGEGKWEVKLPALKPGGPYTIQIADKTLKDVLSGDVVLCSGQSNMELYVYRVEDMYGDLISQYSNDKVVSS
ncbi:MAG: hypothetical protein K2H71_06745 [Muribaculaceae bacterium]|nr:hypothetical protein [Muribaculaceae bacterium]